MNAQLAQKRINMYGKTNELLAQAITEKVAKVWYELEGNRPGFETKTSIFMAVIDVLENGVEV